MIGASSTWYAISARLRSSRSSCARAAGSEVRKQLLRRVDDRVRLLLLEAGTAVDPTPGDGDAVHAGRPRGPHVEGRVPDVGALARRDAQPARRHEQGLRIGLVPVGLV